MGSFFQRKPVRCFLTVFKWCRVTVLLAVLVVVAAIAYLHLVGLPDYLKNPLLRALRQRGFDAQFASARLDWGPAILIENAGFSPTNQATGPRLSAGLTLLELNADALLHARLQVDSFEVLQARLRIPVSPTNLEPLVLTEGNLRVVLPATNQARLNNGTAWFRGIRIGINGEVVDFLSMRDWKFPLPSLPVPAANQAKPGRLSAWEVLQQIHFTGAPALNLHFSADGRDRNTLRAEMTFTAASAQTPWGQSGPLRLRAACARLIDSGHSPIFRGNITASNVSTPWASSRDLAATVDLSRDNQTNFTALFHVEGHDTSTAWHTNWLRVADLRWDGTATLPGPAYVPAMFKGTLKATRAETGAGSTGAASLDLQIRRAETIGPPDPAWGRWNQLRPFTMDWQAEATNILTPKLKLDHVAFQGGWHPPYLTINTLEAAMYRGNLKAGAVLEAASRQVQASVAVHFDPHQISPLLTGPAQHWISLYDWEAAPSVTGGIRFVLPPWTNGITVWPEESRDSIELAGDFSIGRGAYQRIAVTSAQSHFSYTNRVWNVSGLRVAGPGGSLGLDYGWNDLTHDYHFRFDSKLDPVTALPLLTEGQRRTLSEAVFSEPPEIRGEVWGNWRAPETTGCHATLAASHVTVRGEKVDELDATADYTNRILRISQMNLTNASGWAHLPLAGVDFASNVFWMSNASSTMDPEPVRRALRQYAPPFMKEVHFESPPLVQASGSFTPGDDLGTDMRFFVKGDRFHWDGVAADSIRGEVKYHVRTVVLTNLEASAYKTGKLQGWVGIEWDPASGMRFSSDCSASNINLAALARQWSTQGNKLEGMLDGHLTLGAPYDARITNLFGHGGLHVHDGLLWDIQVFGIFSPVLNTIRPGAGNSRAREASADFLITNGVVSTTNLEIRSQGFRLLYRGTVDPQERIKARAEAFLLRDTPVFGHLSWMLLPLDKLFEFRVSGTLQKPAAQPLYIPKVFTAMLHPFHSLKMLMPTPPPKPNSAPPPAKQSN